jgi:hypothetical protein
MMTVQNGWGYLSDYSKLEIKFSARDIEDQYLAVGEGSELHFDLKSFASIGIDLFSGNKVSPQLGPILNEGGRYIIKGITSSNIETFVALSKSLNPLKSFKLIPLNHFQRSSLTKLTLQL